MLDVYNQQWKMRFLNKSNTDDTEHQHKIAGDKYDSTKVWMSCYNQGMICVNWKTKRIEKIFDTNPKTRQIYDFVQLSKNKWLLASQKKIMEWDLQSGILSEKTLPVPDTLSIVCNIRRMILTDNNTCFITTNKGLFKYDLLTHHISAASVTTSKKTEEQFKYILLDGFYDRGILWIASRNGLFSYVVAKKTTSHLQGKRREGLLFL